MVIWRRPAQRLRQPSRFERPTRRFTFGLAVLALVACGDRVPAPEPGVSWELAEQRAATLSDVHYDLEFRIPASVDSAVQARETISFSLGDDSRPVIIDFRAPDGSVHELEANGRALPVRTTAGHLILPIDALHRGDNVIEIGFTAGDMSLNRNPDFLYTLFVPDRASTAFPSFDQPNLKATVRLTLDTPASWRAVANGRLMSTDSVGTRVTYRFGETKPISTYLFAFAAGEFQVETAQRRGRTMNMYHRETDDAKLRRNRDAIFDLHASALTWLEQYTGIPYPFGKFDFVLVPAFQYGGMEHPGAIFYRASSVLLDESATQNQLLGRASLIAHETAHMWFGNLVTMNWFDDVWTKEVFANFMAAKIVNPSFPDIDHAQRFYLRHYPSAYEVDRTAAANPIRQPLDNLQDAGTLYGAIIYQKAPIVMRHLEHLTGESAFREGMQAYLASFAFRNATWPDLIAILDDRAPDDLRSWSQTWVEEPDRPTITVALDATPDGTIDRLVVRQADPAGRERVWNQPLRVMLGWRDSTWSTTTQLAQTSAALPDATGLPIPDYTMAAADGIGYAYFRLDDASRSFLLDHLPALPTPLARSTGWVTLWDAVLEGEVPPDAFVRLTLRALPREPNELNTQRILGYLQSAFWRYLAVDQRHALAADIEATLWSRIDAAPTTSMKAAYFNTLVALTTTSPGVARLTAVWRQTQEIHGLPLSERDFTSMAQELAVRNVDDARRILEMQSDRISNPDRKAQFLFVLPALSANAAVRDSFFDTLRDARNREREPWVLRAISLLNHPLRAQHAERYIRPSLELLEEIQRTGDIFFPKRWLDSTLGGHSSPAAAAAVRSFLDDHPEYPQRLRLKILQSADPVFRAAVIVR